MRNCGRDLLHQFLFTFSPASLCFLVLKNVKIQHFKVIGAFMTFYISFILAI